MDQRSTTTGPRVLGLTGPIGAGKTTVGDLLLELGARERIDADQVVHELQGPATAVSRAIGARFGSGTLAADGSVDRAALAQRVFRDPEALAALESIVHPAVRAEIRSRLSSWTGRPGVIVVDAVKLLQSDLLPLTEEVWVVRCDRAEQRRRLIEVRGMTPEQADERLAAQPSFSHARVARVIDNSGTRQALRHQVAAAWQAFSGAAS